MAYTAIRGTRYRPLGPEIAGPSGADEPPSSTEDTVGRGTAPGVILGAVLGSIVGACFLLGIVWAVRRKV